MTFACQYCGGLEMLLLAGIVATWGWGCCLVVRLYYWWRNP